MPKHKIPDRWEAYSYIGKVVAGTKFIAFKVPLNWKTDWNLHELKKCVPELRSIIDLTNTSRYYSPADCARQGLKHRKIFTPGHGVVPENKSVQQFFSAVDTFSSDNDDGLIGVHCTHGLNRTGYMICRYMIEKKGFKPEDAIQTFNEARGHKQERENYLEDLKTKAWENRLSETPQKHDDFNHRDNSSSSGGKFSRRDKNRQRAPYYRTGSRSDQDQNWRSRDNNFDWRQGDQGWRQGDQGWRQGDQGWRQGDQGWRQGDQGHGDQGWRQGDQGHGYQGWRHEGWNDRRSSQRNNSHEYNRRNYDRYYRDDRRGDYQEQYGRKDYHEYDNVNRKNNNLSDYIQDNSWVEKADGDGNLYYVNAARPNVKRWVKPGES